jgi:hypothetical protein
VKAGRRPLDPRDQTVSVSIGLPSRQFHTLCSEASRARVSLPEIIRRKLELAEKAEKNMFNFRRR